MKKLFLALVCMVTLMAVTSCGGTATPTAAAEEGLEMIKAGNYEGFVETIYFGEKATEEEVKQAKEMYVSLFKEKGDKQITKKGGIASYNVLSEEVAEDGKTAKVAYEIVYGDGSKEEQKFDMVLVDGAWKQEIKK